MVRTTDIYECDDEVDGDCVANGYDRNGGDNIGD
jgi:hypothetical protein